MDTKKRIFYFDGLKGIGCFMIMICHYFALIKYSQKFYISFSGDIILKINESNFKPLIDEAIWLQLFFLISGYLISMSKIESIKKLLVKFYQRFIRFFIPILFACGTIYLLSSMVGFFNSKTSAIFLNEWFQSFYNCKIHVLDVFTESFKIILLGNSNVFNPPIGLFVKCFMHH